MFESTAIGQNCSSIQRRQEQAMDFALSEEQQMVVDTVRSFVETEIHPHEAEVERLGYVPQELARQITAKVQDMGFYAPNMPEEVGGGGLDHVKMAMLERELGSGSMGLDTIMDRPPRAHE